MLLLLTVSAAGWYWLARQDETPPLTDPPPDPADETELFETDSDLLDDIGGEHAPVQLSLNSR